jgi:3'(2'), 5'-bisphosphate nucleotidase
VVFIAERGAGAWMQIHRDAALRGSAQPIHVSGPGEERNLRMVQSVVSAHGNADLQQAVAQAVGISAEPLQLDSQAKYGAVARGDAALYLRLPSQSTPNYRERIWDHAAGLLIVEEAGGRVTDMRGQRLDFTTGRRLERNTGIVASNGALHDDVLDALEQMSPPHDGETG